MVRTLHWLTLLIVSGCLVDVTGPVSQGAGTPSGGGDVGGETSSGGAPNGGAASGGGAGAASGGGGAGAGGAGAGGEATGGAPAAQHCPSGEFITTIRGGEISCSPIDPAASQALAESCTVYSGWRNDCGAACTMLPDRYGTASSSGCVAPGQDSTCQTHNLGADLGVQLFGLDVDGIVGAGDRFYAAINCLPGNAAEAPCGAGNFVTGYDGEVVECRPISGAIVDYVRPSCSLVTGWRDMCTGCPTAPAKYARSSSTVCSSGVGDTCAQVMLGSEVVQLASFSTEGAVGEDDTFYVGLRCEDVTSRETAALGACPTGEFAVGLEADGSLVCRGLAETAMTAFRDHCSLFYGWRDGCNACTDPPFKWGRVKADECVQGAGQDNTCITMDIAGQSVHLFGLNTDGIVDGNDKFYISFECK